MITLTNEQALMCEYAKQGHNILVDACIGSGKTTAIQHLCSKLSGKKILYLTYNKLLKLDAKAKIKNRNVYVTNYHGFAYSELSRIGVRTGLSELITTYNRKCPKPIPYDIMVLDEYQDINTEISQMLLNIKRQIPHLQIIAVGDMDQKLYDWTTLDVRAFIVDLLGEHFIPMEFTTCFRLNESFAASLGEVWEKRIVGVNDSFTVSFMTSDDVYATAKELKPKDLLVLGSKTGNAVKLQNRLEKYVPEVFNKYTLWSKIMEGDGASSPTPDCAIFTTFDGSKGMERDTAIVFDWSYPYWISRTQKPNTNPDIIKNIFLVAASRAKRHLILVNDGMLMNVKRFQGSIGPKRELTDVTMSEMFDYKQAELVEACFADLQVEVVNPPGEEINIPLTDGMIDLSPCIGHYQEELFFKNNNLDQTIADYLAMPDRGWLWRRYQNYSMTKKLLYLAALETRQIRYLNQVKDLPITEATKEAIKKRLSVYFTEDDSVQIPCAIQFLTNKEPINVTGVMDVQKEGVVHELKFVKALSHTHALQLAMYLAATKTKTGYLYNTRTGERWKVEISDIETFFSHVVRCISKGSLRMTGYTIIPPTVEITSRTAMLRELRNRY